MCVQLGEHKVGQTVEQPHRELHIAWHPDTPEAGFVSRPKNRHVAEFADGVSKSPLDLVRVLQIGRVSVQYRRLFLCEPYLFITDALSSADIISASVAPFSVVLASSALILSMIELRSAMSGRPPFAPFHAFIKETHRLGPVRLDQQRKKPLASDHKFRQRSAGLSLSVKLGLLFRRGCLV